MARFDFSALPSPALILASLDFEATRNEDRDVVTHITWSRWTESDRHRGLLAARPARWFVPSYLACGDYNSTGLVERSNLRVFKERFADGEGRWWLSVTGGYGTDAVVVRTLAYRVIDEVREFFDALESYPLADESDHSALEQESQTEDWGNYGRSDFRRAMLLECSDDAGEDAVEALTDKQVDALYWALCRATGSYPESEGSGGASLFHEDDMAAAWAAGVPSNGYNGRVNAFEVPRLVNGAIFYATVDVVAWRGLLDATDEPQVRCTAHEDCNASHELATACYASRADTMPAPKCA